MGIALTPNNFDNKKATNKKRQKKGIAIKKSLFLLALQSIKYKIAGKNNNKYIIKIQQPQSVSQPFLVLDLTKNFFTKYKTAKITTL